MSSLNQALNNFLYQFSLAKNIKNRRSMNMQPKNALVWRQGITIWDATKRRLWINLRDVIDASEETYLISLLRDISEIWTLWKEDGFIYIDNINILNSHLLSDGLHLLETGKCLWAKYFINTVNNFFHMHTHQCKRTKYDVD